jgi:hypothetical protein
VMYGYYYGDQIKIQVHVAIMGQKRDACKVLVRKHEV